MFRAVRILLTSCGFIFLLGGCQSEAEFSRVCGNGVLEGDEPCDGELLDPALDTCAKNQMGEGDVHCNTDCTLNFDQCTGENECNPVAKTGCDGFASCYVTTVSGDLSCIPTSTGELGETCSATTKWCKPGLQCTSTTGGTCLQLCWSQEDCSDGVCNPYSSWTTGLGFCI